MKRNSGIHLHFCKILVTSSNVLAVVAALLWCAVLLCWCAVPCLAALLCVAASNFHQWCCAVLCFCFFATLLLLLSCAVLLFRCAVCWLLCAAVLCSAVAALQCRSDVRLYLLVVLRAGDHRATR